MIYNVRLGTVEVCADGRKGRYAKVHGASAPHLCITQSIKSNDAATGDPLLGW